MKRTARSGRRTALRLALGIAGALALAACSTPYQPKGASGGFGFTDRKLGAGNYSVEFIGNGNTSAALVADMFMYRCAELTVQDGYDVFRSAEPGTPSANGFVQPMADDGLGGPAAATDFRSSGGYVPVYVPSTPRTVVFHRMVGVVRMARYAEVPSNVRAWDARAVMKRLEPVVRGKESTPVPQEEIARVALVSGRGPAAAVGTGGTSLDDLQQLLQPKE